MQFFLITPHPKGNGYALTSESLSYPLWYRKIADAVEYAKWLSRAKGCRIETRDAGGDLLWFEENPPGDNFRLLNFHHLQEKATERQSSRGSREKP